MARLLSQGCKVNRLSNTSKKLYGRHTDLVGQYEKNVCKVFAFSVNKTDVHFFQICHGQVDKVSSDGGVMHGEDHIHSIRSTK